ncbi:uncharacterized protein Dana_GF25301 [Drosophila ananassae]|uniref:Thioredoxin domain-containing protein n=1 Tax=Drosophila ananassae TaxID=7217 RepID=B3M4L9_DROAN|nr:uncharacterized protein LOC6507924 [Drosophila ananassae]EDV39418.2 uncharacterized protein Dana_GF25301 [Drosophila ananassae]
MIRSDDLFLFLMISSFYSLFSGLQNQQEDCGYLERKNELCFQTQCREEKYTESVFEIDHDNWEQLLYGKWLVVFCLPLRPDCRDLEGVFYKLADSSQRFQDVNLAFGDLSKHNILIRRFSISVLPAIFHIKEGEFRLLDPYQDKNTLAAILINFDWVDVGLVAFWDNPMSIFVELSVLAYKMAEDFREMDVFGQNFNCAAWLMKFILGSLVISLLWLIILLIEYVKKKQQALVWSDSSITKAPVWSDSELYDRYLYDYSNEYFTRLFEECHGDHSSVEDPTNRVITVASPSDEDFPDEELSVGSVIVEPSCDKLSFGWDDKLEPTTKECFTQTLIRDCNYEYYGSLNRNIRIDLDLYSSTGDITDDELSNHKNYANSSDEVVEEERLFNFSRNDSDFYEYSWESSEEEKENLCSRCLSILNFDYKTYVAIDDWKDETEIEVELFRRALDAYDMDSESFSSCSSEDGYSLESHSYLDYLNLSSSSSDVSSLEPLEDKEDELSGMPLKSCGSENRSLVRVKDIDDQQVGQPDSEENNYDESSSGDSTIKGSSDENSEEGNQTFGFLEIFDDGKYYRYSTNRNPVCYRVDGMDCNYTKFDRSDLIHYDIDTVFVDPPKHLTKSRKKCQDDVVLRKTCVGLTMMG